MTPTQTRNGAPRQADRSADGLRSGVTSLLGGRFINAGEGLSGTSSLAQDVTLSMVPATADTLGGIKVGDGILIAGDGTISGSFGNTIQVNGVGVSDDPNVTVNATPFFTVNGAGWPQR